MQAAAERSTSDPGGPGEGQGPEAAGEGDRGGRGERPREAGGLGEQAEQDGTAAEAEVERGADGPGRGSALLGGRGREDRGEERRRAERDAEGQQRRTGDQPGPGAPDRGDGQPGRDDGQSGGAQREGRQPVRDLGERDAADHDDAAVREQREARRRQAHGVGPQRREGEESAHGQHRREEPESDRQRLPVDQARRRVRGRPAGPGLCHSPHDHGRRATPGLPRPTRRR